MGTHHINEEIEKGKYFRLKMNNNTIKNKIDEYNSKILLFCFQFIVLYNSIIIFLLNNSICIITQHVLLCYY